MDSEYETVTRIHVVQKGDTLYSIAFLNGVDYRDVADGTNWIIRPRSRLVSN